MSSSIRVLCVDDEASFLDLAKLMLVKDRMMDIDVAGSAKEALDILGSSEYDVVVSDFSMPGMDGLELLKAMRARNDATPFIMFTGKGREDVAIEALNSGADFYIQKGVDARAQFAELTMMIRNLAQHRRAELKAQNARNICQILVDTDIAGLIAFDTEMNITMWSKGAERLTGLGSEGMVGKSVTELLSFVKTEGIEELLDDVLSGRQVGLGDISFSIPETGRSGHFKAFASPTNDEEGFVVGGFAVLINTSEEKYYEDALRDSREDYRALFDGAGDAIFIHSLDGRFLDVNKAACASLGYSREELLQMTPKDVDDEESAAKVSDRMEEVLEKGVAFYDVVHVRRDGTKFPVEMSVRVLKHRGQPTFMTIARNVSERRKAEDALRRSEEFLGNIFSSIQDGISVLDSSLTVRRVNPSMEAWYNHAKPIIGKKCYEVHQHRSEPCEDCPAQRTLASGKTETGLVTKRGVNGEIVGWLDVYAFPLVNEKTKDVEGVIEYLRDATERVTAQEALRGSEEKYRQLAELSSEGILAIDADERITFANPRVSEITGYSLDDILGKSVFDFMDSENAEIVRREIEFRNGGVPGHYEVEIVRRDGTEVSVSIGASPLSDESGKRIGSLATIFDLTKRKEIEAALRKANEKLHLLDAVTRHDIVNQLVVLSGYLDMAVRSSNQEKSEDYLGRAREAALTIKNHLEFARDYQALGSEAPEWVDAQVTLDSALASIDLVEIQVESDLGGLELWADAMLEKAFLNLVDNSKRHGEHVTQMKFSYFRKNAEIVIVVEDNGVGIPDEDKEKIFERGHGRNTGLGLFLIREVMGITDCSISESGEHGKGARFEIVVPEGRYKLSKS